MNWRKIFTAPIIGGGGKKPASPDEIVQRLTRLGPDGLTFVDVVEPPQLAPPVISGRPYLGLHDLSLVRLPLHLCNFADNNYKYSIIYRMAASTLSVNQSLFDGRFANDSGPRILWTPNDRMYISHKLDDFFFADYSLTYADDEWHQIVAERVGLTLHITIDGDAYTLPLTGNTTIEDNILPDQAPVLGWMNGTPYIYHMEADVAEFVINEHIYRFSETKGTVAFDSGVNGEHATIYPGETIEAVRRVDSGQGNVSYNDLNGFGRYGETSGLITGDFKFAVIPDMQESSDGRLALWDDVTGWVIDNFTTEGLAFVLDTGDIVNDGTAAAHFARAKPAIDSIDAEDIPLFLCAGNHDYSSGGTQTVDNADMFDANFPQSRMSSATWWESGGFYAADSRNYYAKMTVNGNKIMVLAIDNIPQKTIVTWAKGIMDANQDHFCIFLNHSMLNPNGELLTSADDYWAGEYGVYDADHADATYIWNEIKQASNLGMIISGHIIEPADVGGSPSSVMIASDGHAVSAHVTNFHYLGDPKEPVPQENLQGYVQVYSIENSGAEVSVRTISTVTDIEPTELQYLYANEMASDISSPDFVRIPAREDGSGLDARGVAITNPGGYVYNGSKTMVRQTDGYFKDGTINFYSAGGVDIDDVGGFDWITHNETMNGSYNLWVRLKVVNGVTFVDEVAQYPLDYVFTAAETAKNLRYYGGSIAPLGLTDSDGELIYDTDGELITTI